jgi:hypothetical protein
VLVEIRGTDLPGRRCGPNPYGDVYENIHVGIGRGDTLSGLVPGDAPSACWQIEVKTGVHAEGNIDFGGPFVRGKRGERFLYLSWGTIAVDGSASTPRGRAARSPLGWVAGADRSQGAPAVCQRATTCHCLVGRRSVGAHDGPSLSTRPTLRGALAGAHGRLALPGPCPRRNGCVRFF